MPKPSTVEQYIAQFPEATQVILKQIRAVIRKAAPMAEERLGYGMPGYYLNGPLVYFAAYKNHIGFYATPNGHEAFAQAFSKYKQGKGSVQFPLQEPMPFSLIEAVVRYRLQSNSTSATSKKTTQ
ncbi:MAG: DUF1801 domain-containing protein [Cytophagaceae bacterium]|jgi:uncharacterized protein YdhG (YjbR/CyaY superfamily)|nr:DUF1801 domain-containing protein [Cytophagaceae bacterium]